MHLLALQRLSAASTISSFQYLNQSLTCCAKCHEGQACCTSVLWANCLVLGIDLSLTQCGVSAGSSVGPRRHSQQFACTVALSSRRSSWFEHRGYLLCSGKCTPFTCVCMQHSSQPTHICLHAYQTLAVKSLQYIPMPFGLFTFRGAC